MLTGLLPDALSVLTRLMYFSLETNTGLTGTLPASWSSLVNLQTLHLGSIGVTGPLPPEYSSMTALQACNFH